MPWFRFLQIGVSLVFLSGLVLNAPKLMDWINQPIARVEVHAPFRHLEPERIEQNLLMHLQDRFFALDLEAIRQQLLAMPWIKKVSVRRAWPDRLLVSVDEQQAIARWGERQLISSEGEVFTPDSLEVFSGLPKLVGLENRSEEVLQQYLAISQLLRPIGLGISRLEMTETGGWNFTAGHVVVNMGRDRKMERLQRFIRLYHTRLETEWNSVTRVDLRYLNGVAVAWNEELTELSAGSL